MNRETEWDEFGRTLHHIDKRVALVEQEVNDLVGVNRWIRGIAFVMFVQIIGAVIAFVKLSEQVDQLHIEGLKTNVSTALQVLADHGNELEGIRAEDARLRGVIDTVREEMTQRTFDRFTGKEGDRLRARVQRLEEIIYAQD